MHSNSKRCRFSFGVARFVLGPFQRELQKKTRLLICTFQESYLASKNRNNNDSSELVMAPEPSACATKKTMGAASVENGHINSCHCGFTFPIATSTFRTNQFAGKRVRQSDVQCKFTQVSHPKLQRCQTLYSLY
jgi:hypothetical protein